MSNRPRSSTDDDTDFLASIRTNSRRRWSVVVLGVLAGMLLAQFHWLGFVVGGALVALPQPSLGRGLVAGFGFGVVAWCWFVATIALQGQTVLAVYTGMGEVFALSVAIPVVGGLLGSLARGVVSP